MVISIIGTTPGGGVIINVNGVPQTVPPTYAALKGTSYYIQPTDTSGASTQTIAALTQTNLNIGSYTGSGQTVIPVSGSTTPIIIPYEIPAGSTPLVEAIENIRTNPPSEQQIIEINKQLENATTETTPAAISGKISQLNISNYILPIALIGILLISGKNG